MMQDSPTLQDGDVGDLEGSIYGEIVAGKAEQTRQDRRAEAGAESRLMADRAPARRSTAAMTCSDTTKAPSRAIQTERSARLSQRRDRSNQRPALGRLWVACTVDRRATLKCPTCCVCISPDRHAIRWRGSRRAADGLDWGWSSTCPRPALPCSSCALADLQRARFRAGLAWCVVTFTHTLSGPQSCQDRCPLAPLVARPISEPRGAQRTVDGLATLQSTGRDSAGESFFPSSHIPPRSLRLEDV